MKLSKIALAVIASSIAPLTATAGVTVSPLLLGYHYTDQASAEQRNVLRVGKNLNEGLTTTPTLNGGVTLKSGLYTGAAIGIELTPSTQFQVEYGVANTTARASRASEIIDPANRFDAEQQTLSGNLLVGFDQFTGYSDSKFKPYALIGAGQSKISVKNQQAYTTTDASQTGKTGTIVAGTEVAESKDTIGNVGLGARYLVNDALAVRGEARATHNFDNKWWEGLALAGLEVTLGGRLTPTVPVPPMATPVQEVQPIETEVIPQPQPEPEISLPQPEYVQHQPEPVLDSDMDGVPDHLDACPGTPRNLVVDARGCPIPVDVEKELRMELRVFFDRDKSAIKPQYRQEVAKVAEAMREYPNASANIEGHASRDSARSSAKYNQRLSEARANAVKSMLSSEFGIAPNRLNAVGHGFNRPIASNDTAEGRAQNRRVYATIEGTKVTRTNQTIDMNVR